MELQALQISTRASKILGREDSFRVKAAFRHVVNFQGDSGEIFAVQTPTTAFTPLSVTISLPEFQKLQQVQAGCKIDLHIHHGPPTDCYLPTTDGVCSQQRWDDLRRLTYVLAKSDSLAPAADDSLWDKLEYPNPVQYAAKEILDQSVEHLAKKDYPGATTSLAGLSGLGPGLTPGGDDFLLGVLAACQYWKKSTPPDFGPLLFKETARRYKQCTWLSAALLHCGEQGEYSWAIRDILMAEDHKALTRAVASGVTWGHTSGSDTLGGILWMAAQIRR